MSHQTTHVTGSEDETRLVASRLAAGLQSGAVLLLSGELGAGKTTFVRGLAAGLGIDPDEVTSPTFTLVHEYGGGRLPFGLDGELAARGVLAIEWAERLTRTPFGAVTVTIEDRGGEGRTITIVQSSKFKVQS